MNSKVGYALCGNDFLVGCFLADCLVRLILMLRFNKWIFN